MCDDDLQWSSPAWNEQARQAPSRLVAKMGGVFREVLDLTRKGSYWHIGLRRYVLASFLAKVLVYRDTRARWASADKKGVSEWLCAFTLQAGTLVVVAH